ncbi:MAG TPA: hypothetical protein VH144_01405 [Candidatus Saccharimonadales bacterium]|nr:hypothetical protein [Candidatus Saccharimonadales bacterium]
MKRRISSLISVAILLLATATTAVTRADPADITLSQDQLDTIRTNCTEAEGQLQRVQRADAVSRTNRGRAYDATLQLMAAFNSRVAINKVSAPKLAENTTALQAKFEQFYNDFTRYDSSMTSTTRVKCQDQPAVFYATLTQTRGLRVQLANDIRDMDKLIDEYTAAVAELKTTVLKDATPTGTPQ